MQYNLEFLKFLYELETQALSISPNFIWNTKKKLSKCKNKTETTILLKKIKQEYINKEELK